MLLFISNNLVKKNVWNLKSSCECPWAFHACFLQAFTATLFQNQELELIEFSSKFESNACFDICYQLLTN